MFKDSYFGIHFVVSMFFSCFLCFLGFKVYILIGFHGFSFCSPVSNLVIVYPVYI